MSVKNERLQDILGEYGQGYESILTSRGISFTTFSRKQSSEDEGKGRMAIN